MRSLPRDKRSGLQCIFWVGRGYTVHGIAMSKQPSWAPCLDPPTLSGGARGPPVPTLLAFWAWLFHALGSAGQCPGDLRPWPASIPPPQILPTSLQGPPACHLPQTGSWESRRASRVPCETRPTATRSTPPLTLASLGPFSVSGYAVPGGSRALLGDPGPRRGLTPGKKASPGRRDSFSGCDNGRYLLDSFVS